MQPLAELQRYFADAALLGNIPELELRSAVAIREAFAAHRDTVVGGLVNALRLSFPTVDALVGERFFDQAAQLFAEAHPPHRANLDYFGGSFVEFLGSLPSATGLPYMADVARLDWSIGQALRQPIAHRAFALEANVSILLPQSLHLLRLSYPAHAIRAAIGDDSALASLHVGPAEYRLAVWRKDDQAAVQPIRVEAGEFLNALMAGESVEAAIQAAGADSPLVGQAIQQDVFAASFCQIQTPSEESQ